MTQSLQPRPRPAPLPPGRRVLNHRLARLESRLRRQTPPRDSVVVSHIEVLMAIYCQLPPAAQARFIELPFIEGWVVFNREGSPREEAVYIGFAESRAVRNIRKALRQGARFGYLQRGSTRTTYVSRRALLEPVRPQAAITPDSREESVP